MERERERDMDIYIYIHKWTRRSLKATCGAGDICITHRDCCLSFQELLFQEVAQKLLEISV